MARITIGRTLAADPSLTAGGGFVGIGRMGCGTVFSGTGHTLTGVEGALRTRDGSLFIIGDMEVNERLVSGVFHHIAPRNHSTPAQRHSRGHGIGIFIVGRFLNGDTRYGFTLHKVVLIVVLTGIDFGCNGVDQVVIGLIVVRTPFVLFDIEVTRRLGLNGYVITRLEATEVVRAASVGMGGGHGAAIRLTIMVSIFVEFNFYTTHRRIAVIVIVGVFGHVTAEFTQQAVVARIGIGDVVLMVIYPFCLTNVGIGYDISSTRFETCHGLTRIQGISRAGNGTDLVIGYSNMVQFHVSGILHHVFPGHRLSPVQRCCLCCCIGIMTIGRFLNIDRRFGFISHFITEPFEIQRVSRRSGTASISRIFIVHQISFAGAGRQRNGTEVSKQCRIFSIGYIRRVRGVDPMPQRINKDNSILFMLLVVMSRTSMISIPGQSIFDSDFEGVLHRTSEDTGDVYFGRSSIIKMVSITRFFVLLVSGRAGQRGKDSFVMAGIIIGHLMSMWVFSDNSSFIGILTQLRHACLGTCHTLSGV